MQLFRATGGDHWARKSGWGEPETKAPATFGGSGDGDWGDTVDHNRPGWCSWEGISCQRLDGDEGSLTPKYILSGLELAHNNLRGVLPLSLLCSDGVFSRLRLFNVSHNRLRGDGLVFHSLEESCPRNSRILKHLVTVDVSYNELNATLHTFLLRTFPKLRFVHARRNHLSGPLLTPADLASAVALSSTSGESPSHDAALSPSQAATNFPSLEVFDIGENRVLGQFPTAVFAYHSPHLRELYLDNNFLVDHSLTWLHVRAAEGVGSGLGWHHTLAVLHLENNYIQASIPSMISRYTNMRELVLDGNRIYGTLPRDIRSLRLLSRLSVAHNYLRGTVPCGVDRWFGEQTPFLELKHVDLTDNDLDGPICEVPVDHTIEVLRLADNAFSGKLPPLRGRNLKEVTLGGENRWHCELPQAADIPSWLDPAPSTKCVVEIASAASGNAPRSDGWWDDPISSKRQRRRSNRAGTAVNQTLAAPLGQAGQHLFSAFLTILLVAPISIAIVTAAGVVLPSAFPMLAPEKLLKMFGYVSPNTDDEEELH